MGDSSSDIDQVSQSFMISNTVIYCLLISIDTGERLTLRWRSYQYFWMTFAPVIKKNKKKLHNTLAYYSNIFRMATSSCDEIHWRFGHWPFLCTVQDHNWVECGISTVLLLNNRPCDNFRPPKESHQLNVTLCVLCREKKYKTLTSAIIIQTL